jgi:hypothetical protein
MQPKKNRKIFDSKLDGYTYLKSSFTRAKKNPSQRFITIDLIQAEEIIEKTMSKEKYTDLDLRSNSLRAGALTLCISPKELLERLKCPLPSKIMEELANAKTKIKEYEHIGDKMVIALGDKNYGLTDQWSKARKL